MQVVINGRERELPNELTVTALLSEFGLNAERTVVELNRVVVDKAAYDTTVIRKGDVIELVEVVGGG